MLFFLWNGYAGLPVERCQSRIQALSMCSDCVYSFQAMKAFNLHVRMSEQDFYVFREVAEATGASGVSTAVRALMREKHRELGLGMPTTSAKPKAHTMKRTPR